MSRKDRLEQFELFFNEAEKIFESFAKLDATNARLAPLHSLCITPGGRSGGRDKTIVEVFYGRRPLDSVEELGDDYRPRTRIISAQGATLRYQRTDSGRVMCNLYPSKTQSLSPIEDCILLDYIATPAKLTESKLRRHWGFFVAYMDVTNVEDVAGFWNAKYVWYLRNFRQTVINEKVQKTKASLFFTGMSEIFLGVGCSGFLIFFLSAYNDSYKDNATVESLSRINVSIKDTTRKATELAGKLQIIENNISESNKLLQLIKQDSAGIIYEISTLNKNTQSMSEYIMLRDSQAITNDKDRDLPVTVDNSEEKVGK